MSILQKNISATQAKDTGLAVTLILLLFVYWGEYGFLVLPALIVLILTMIWPSVFTPLARVWFGLSRVLGTIISNMLLSTIFFSLVTPIGFIRKQRGADAMRLNEWKKSHQSVFVSRDMTYTAEHLNKPY